MSIIRQQRAAELEPARPEPPELSIRARFVSGAFWSVLGAVLTRGLSLLAAVFAGRLLGTVQFGELGMIQSTQGLFGVFAGAGLGLAATKHIAEYRAGDPGRAGRCIRLCLQIAVVTGAIATVCLVALSGWIADQVLARPWLERELQLASGLVCLRAINGVCTGVLAGLERFRFIAWVGVARGVFLVVAMVVGVSYAGLLGAVLALVLAEVVSALANGIAMRRCCPTATGKNDWRQFTEVWRFSVLSLLGNLATMPALWFANLMLVRQPGGYASLGLFNAAERWRQALQFLPTALSSTILSLLSNLHGSRDGRSYRSVIAMNLGLTFVVVVLPAVVLMLLAQPAMGLFGADYRPGATTLIILAASAVAFVLNDVLGQVLVSQGAVGLRLALDVALAVILAGVAWWLIPVWGANGLALGHLVGYGAAVLLLLVPVWHYVRQSGRPSATALPLNPAEDVNP